MSLRALGTAALSALKEAAPRAARGAPTPPAPHQGHTRPARKAAEAYLRDHVFIVYSAGATRQQRAHSVSRTAWLRLRCPMRHLSTSAGASAWVSPRLLLPPESLLTARAQRWRARRRCLSALCSAVPRLARTPGAGASAAHRAAAMTAALTTPCW